MASEILGLFSSPELYQQQQDLMQQQQAAQLAQLDPYARVRYNAIRAGQQAGSALGSIFGVQDPQLKLISARQQVMQNIDPSNPDAVFQAAQQLANIGDQQGALTLADYARKAQSEMALQQQRLREGKAAATPKEIAIARERAQLQAQIAQLEATPPSPERDQILTLAKNTLAGLTTAVKEPTFGEDREAKSLELYDKPYGQLTTDERKAVNAAIAKPEKDVRFGVEREAIAEEVYGKPFGQLTQTQKAAVNKRVEAEKGTVAEKNAPKLVLPGQGKEGPKDIPAFRDKVISTIDPFRKTVTAADQAVSNITDSINNNNFASFRAAQTQFARAISGAGDLSQRELKAAGADPSLLGGSADYLSTLFTSTPTRDTQEKILSTLKAIRKVAAKKAREEIDTQKRIAARSNYDQEDIKLIFNFPEFEPKPAPTPAAGGAKQTTRTLKSGKVVTIIQDED